MDGKPQLIGVAPLLIVLDVKKTAEYYRDSIGFSIIGYFSDPPVYAMVARDGFQIHFGKADGEYVPVNENVRKGTPDLIIWVPEIEAFYNELKANNVDIVEGIVKRVYGSREIIIRDCDGHKILIGD